MNKRFLYLTICFAAFAISAYADPLACQPGLVSSIANTTCTIGDKTLAFGDAAITGNNPFGLTTDQFTFIPDSSNPIAPSFQLVGTIVGITVGGTTLSLQLDASAAAPLITGLTSSFVGDTPVPGTFTGGYTIFQGCDPTLTDCANANAGFAAAVCPATSNTCSDSFAADFAAFVNPISPSGFNVGYGAQADIGSVATVLSATFTINETASAVPEPSSVVLLGISLIGVLAGRKRLFKARKA